MAAIDFDTAMNESKRPRKDEDAERKKQEREDAKEPTSFAFSVLASVYCA